MRESLTFLAAVLSLGLAGSSPVRAGGLGATYGGELRDAGHRVSARLDRRAVIMKVRRRIENRGARVEEATLDLALPPWAVATGLRIRDRGSWRAGELLEAEDARRRYRDLTTQGPRSRRGPALLSWSSTGSAELTLFPIAARQEREVEIELLAAPCYADGFYAVAYPRGAGAAPSIAARGRGALVVPPGNQLPERHRDLIERCRALGYEGEAGAGWILFPSPVKRRASAAYARFELSETRHLLRLELDTAKELAPAPRRARVIFVIDASRSQGREGIDAQLELARGYLAHLPDASFEVILYRREAERLFGRFVAAARAGELFEDLPRHVFEPGNGSHLERALSLAGTLARGARGPVRVVAFTDSRLRSALSTEEVEAAAPARGVLHLVHTELDGATYGYRRHDAHPLAPAAAQTGGMLVSMSGASGGRPAAKTAMLGLVRPIQIDHVAVEAEAGVGERLLSGDSVLEEGDALRRTVLARAAPDELVVRGKIWGRDFVRRLSPDRSLSVRLAALVFGIDLWGELEKEEIAQVAQAGGALSPATSYLAVPEAPPSSYDYADRPSIGIGRMIGGGAVVSTRCGGVGVLRRGAARPVVDHEAILRRMLRPRVRACAAAFGAAGRISLELELTGVEIVDVKVDSVEPALSACVADAAWELYPDEGFSGGVRRVDLAFNAGR